MGDPANKQETKTEKPMTSVPVVPRKDPNNKSPLDGKKITPTAPSKPQGLWFKKLVNKVGPAGHKLFFTLHFLVPLLILVLVLLHITELHKTGRRDSLASLDYSNSTSFSLFIAKDIINLLVLFGLVIVSLVAPH